MRIREEKFSINDKVLKKIYKMVIDFSENIFNKRTISLNKILKNDVKNIPEDVTFTMKLSKGRNKKFSGNTIVNGNDIVFNFEIGKILFSTNLHNEKLIKPIIKREIEKALNQLRRLDS